MSRLGSNPAVRAYTKRVIVWMSLYVIVLVAVDFAIRRHAPHGALLYALAVLPALPIVAVFVALGRYLVEESDEYLRAQMIRQILYATGLTLFATTIWGMLAALAEVRPLDHVAVLWFACFGLAALIIRVQDR